MRIEAGSLFAGYTVVKQLGRGGLATVYLVREPGIDRLVALKVLPEQLVDDARFAERFEQEARVIGSLDHPNIIPLYRYGITDDVPWMALRYVDGGDFSARLAAHPLPIPEGLALLRGVASALDYAHRKGVIHRDLKPQNILLTGDGAVYLADFGVAKLLEGTMRLKTATGSVMGTPAYMAPEQAKSAQLGPYTDVYALAVICFQWLTGSLPFDADTPYAILMKHVIEPLPSGPLALLAPNVAAVLERGLAKLPEDRFQSASTLIAQLEHALYAPATRPLPAATMPPRQRTDAAAATASKPKQHHWIAAGVIALALPLAIAGYMYWRGIEMRATEQQTAQQRAADDVVAKQEADAASAKRAGDEAVKKAEAKREADKHAVEELPVNPPVVNLTAEAAERAKMEKLAEEKRVAATATATTTLGLSVKGISAKPPVETTAAATKRALEKLAADAAAAKAVEEKRAANKLVADATMAKLAEAMQGTLIIKADAACQLSVNGEAKGALLADQAKTLRVSPGEQLIECATNGTSGVRAQETKNAAAGAQAVVVLALADKVAGEQKKEQQRAAVEIAARNPQNLGFIDLGNGVLKDTKTGLQWTQSDNGAYISWYDAKSYCERKGGGWRLPSVDELAAIYDPNVPSPKVCFVFHGTSNACKISHLFNLTVEGFWSGTQNGSAEAWGVDLKIGARYSGDVSANGRALCARRPEEKTVIDH